ncbi:MAG: biotin/lipoyl-containing protein [Bryobacteraceae bacterium]
MEVDGESYWLDLEPSGAHSEYTLDGAAAASGKASVIEVLPGEFSILLGHRSFNVQILPAGDELEVWTGNQRHLISISDPRDRASKSKKITAAGPMAIRAQMPGKVIKVLVQPGAGVKAGEGVIIVEAMKMQNEMKSPKDGIVSKIQATEGATVLAGETLLVIE